MFPHWSHGPAQTGYIGCIDSQQRIWYSLRMHFATRIAALALALCAMLSLTACKTASPLFNSRTLDGWVAVNGGEWTIEEGVLIGRNGSNWTTNPEQSGSWLRTQKEYGDFVLDLEYAINTKGNSGIHFRSALDKNPSFTGYEMQILDDAGREPRKSGTGAIYDVVAPFRSMSKPAGEWNRVRIICEGQRIRIRLNGTEIVDHSDDRSARGFIGLQNHDAHSVIKFRNIRIRELPGDN